MPDDFLAPFLTRISEKIPGVSTDELTTLQRTANVNQAVREYSRHAPRSLVKDIAGDGSYEYTLPTEWIEEFSSIQKIEYPAGVSQNPEDATLAPETYGVYKNATASKLRFYSITPAAGKTIRATISVPHSVAAAASTVFVNDFDSVCALASAFCCFDLARKYAQDNDSFISADSVDRKSKSEKYLSLGKSLVSEFAVHFGLDKDAETMAGSTYKNFDMFYPGGVDQITHPAEDR